MNIAYLSGGVGGARLARGLAEIGGIDLTIIVNVGDDDTDYGLAVSPDIDTVISTLAHREGPEGWGRRDDTFAVMDAMAALGVDTTMRIGDRDLATKLIRTRDLAAGVPLSEITGMMAEAHGIGATVLPVTDDRLRTRIQVGDGSWLSFREYFVHRGHADEVADVRFDGAADATPAPGVVDALRTADVVVIGPSNPVLSIWPILAVLGPSLDGRSAHCVSPLIGGRAVRGPADRILTSLGYPPGNLGVLRAYDGLVHTFVIDPQDGAERAELTADGTVVHVRDTDLSTRDRSRAFAEWLVETL